MSRSTLPSPFTSPTATGVLSVVAVPTAVPGPGKPTRVVCENRNDPEKETDPTASVAGLAALPTVTRRNGPAGTASTIEAVVPSDRVTEKVRFTGAGPVLMANATSPPESERPSGRVKMPVVSPENVAAMPPGVMSRAPLQWLSGVTVTNPPSESVRSATAMLTSGELPGRRSMTMLPPRL